MMFSLNFLENFIIYQYRECRDVEDIEDLTVSSSSMKVPNTLFGGMLTDFSRSTAIASFISIT